MGLGLGAVLIPVLQKIHVTNKPGTVSAVSTVVQIMPFSIFNEKHFSQLTLKSYSFLQGSPTSKSRYLLFSIGKKEARKKKKKQHFDHFYLTKSQCSADRAGEMRVRI